MKSKNKNKSEEVNEKMRCEEVKINVKSEM